MKSSDANELAEEIVRLVRAAINAQYPELRSAGRQIAEILDAEGSRSEAKEIASLLRRRAVPLRASGQLEKLPIDARSSIPLLEEVPWPETPIFLDEAASTVFAHFIDDAEHSEILSEKGISSPLGLLLSGPPGTGKTLLAGHVAAKLKRPLYVVRLDALISSLLGETAKNIRFAFDFLPHKRAVLLMDEIDAIAKIRDDRYELGEIKRVVNTLIQALDSLDDQTVVIGATNHLHLLDIAIFRRFPYAIKLDMPNDDVRRLLWRHFLFEDQGKPKIADSLGVISDSLSGAEIREISMRARRRSAIAQSEIDFAMICQEVMFLKETQSLVGSAVSDEAGKLDSLVRFLCKSHGVKQVDAAELLGVTRQTVAAHLREMDE